MNTSTTATNSLSTADLTDLAHYSANIFAGDRGHEGLAEILAEQIAGQRLLADRMQIDWSSVRKLAGEIYAAQVKAAKPAKQPKTPKAKIERAPLEAGEVFKLYMTDPSGREIIDVTTTLYNFAVLQKKDGVWGIRSRVNTKVVASSRCHTFRKAGVAKDDLAVVEVADENVFRNFAKPALIEPYAAEAAAAKKIKQPKVAKPAKEPKAARKPRKAVEVVAEPEVVEHLGMNFQFAGSEKVHAPNSKYDGALCGASKGKDPVQTEAEVNCKSCGNLKKLFALAAEAQAVAE